MFNYNVLRGYVTHNTQNSAVNIFKLQGKQICTKDNIKYCSQRGPGPPATPRAPRSRAAGLDLPAQPPGTPPRAAYFPLRNRLISALASAVVVVEARLRSGSLVTARHALDQGGEGLAVPGASGAPTSEGTNRLLRDGARPCLDASDELDALGWSEPVRPRAPARSGRGTPRRARRCG